MVEYYNVAMGDFTTLRTGSVARRMLVLETEDDVKRVFDSYGHDLYIIGNGSNVLVSSPIDIVVKLSKTFAAARGIQSICRALAEQKRSGLEFAMGIPATLGGAIFMNAGGSSGEMSDIIESVVIYDGEIREIEPIFSYRESGIHGIILDATFKTTFDTTENIMRRMKDILKRKADSQPLAHNTAGCIFKNPDSVSAGQIIDQCQLKSHRVGGACVSPLHANFIVCEHGSTPQNVLDLINHIQTVVFNAKGVNLETEIEIWPRSSEKSP